VLAGARKTGWEKNKGTNIRRKYCTKTTPRGRGWGEKRAGEGNAREIKKERNGGGTKLKRYQLARRINNALHTKQLKSVQKREGG